MLGIIQAIVYLLVGLATGVTFASGVGGALVLLVLAILISFAFASLGMLLALRFGTGEAVQGIFPLLFVTIFLSSASLPRNLIKATWFRDVATYNPVSYLLEALRSLVITGWDAQALALGFGFALALLVIALGLAGGGDEVEADQDMSRFVYVARGVAWRSIHNTLVNPAILVPSIVFPLFFLIAFAGGLSRISDVPNFHYPPGYTSFQFVFVFLQSAAFGGVFTGFAVARDFDSGFARRLLLSAPRRSGIIAGYTVGALLRWALTGTVVTIAALIAGMNVDGNGVQLIGLLGSGHRDEPRRRPVGGRPGDVPSHRAGRGGHPDAGVRAPVPRPGLRAGDAAHRLDPRCRQPQPGHAGAGGRPRPVGGIAGQGGNCLCRSRRRGRRPVGVRPPGAGVRGAGRVRNSHRSNRPSSVD